MSKKKREEMEERERRRKKEEENKLYEEELQREYEKEVKEYEEFLSKYDLLKGGVENNVELNEPFMFRDIQPNGVPHPKEKLKLIKMDDNFEFIEYREFDIRKPFHKGGSTKIYYVFRPIKKGKGKIIFQRALLNITIN